MDADAVDETPDAADPVSIKRVRQRRKFEEDLRGDFWRRVLAEPIGRQVMWEIIVGCGTFENRFQTGPTGFPIAEETWFHLGRKNIGEGIREILEKADRMAVFTMFEEHKADWQKPKPNRATHGGEK